MTTLSIAWNDHLIGSPVLMAGLPSSRSAPTSAGLKESTTTAFIDQSDIEQTLRGDEDAFRDLIERHQARICRMMWRFTRNPVDHDDLVQDVFIEVYKSLPRFKGRAPFEHWLARIATRTGYRYWKHRKHAPDHVPLEEWDGALPTSPEILSPTEAGELLHHLLACLPPRDRLVLTLRYFEDLDIQEIAQRTGWSKTMVKVQTMRARQKLKQLLEQRQIHRMKDIHNRNTGDKR